MPTKRQAAAAAAPAPAAGNKLIKELWTLRRALLESQEALQPWLRDIAPQRQPSAINLAHYLALRRLDLRHLQDELARLGVSSLGRAETHVLANVDKVLGLLHRLESLPWTSLSQEEPSGYGSGSALLATHVQALFGPPPAQRATRIMVTMPGTAAHDMAMVRGLVDAGMDIARINCAHDGPDDWVAMADHVRQAAAAAGRRVQVLMDLGGPKLRTGAMASAPAVVRLKPQRDAFGQRTAPARLGLRPAGSALAVAGAPHCLGVDAGWLGRLQPGSRVELVDARGAQRRLHVVERQGAAVLAECRRSAFLTPQTRLHLLDDAAEDGDPLLEDFPQPAGQIHLHRGDRLLLLDEGLGRDADPAVAGRRAVAARIACTLPEALARMRKGERIWFDDGRIGGVVRRGGRRRVEIDITEAREGGEKLAADKGINLPDTVLDLPALTPKDLQDLPVVARVADLVGLSFAQSAADVRMLRQRLDELQAGDLGLILKIETRRGFERLPEMLLAAMAGPSAGVMIARGDLAVECGYERMAEVQEEILWACEAAHMPVVWATQVLETLARTGLPSRAEITDAAMGGRAECVMLNKGPHIVEAIRTLDDILQRMQAHQTKKRPQLRALKSWKLAHGPDAAAPGAIKAG